MNSFLAGGGDGFAVFKDGTDRLSGGFDLDALVDYLGKNDPTAPPAADRISGNGLSVERRAASRRVGSLGQQVTRCA